MVPTEEYYPDRAYLFAFLLSARLFIKPHELLGEVCALCEHQQNLNGEGGKVSPTNPTSHKSQRRAFRACTLRPPRALSFHRLAGSTSFSHSPPRRITRGTLALVPRCNNEHAYPGQKSLVPQRNFRPDDLYFVLFPPMMCSSPCLSLFVPCFHFCFSFDYNYSHSCPATVSFTSFRLSSLNAPSGNKSRITLGRNTIK